LSLEFREILALKYLRDHDYATLAQLLGIPRGTVMSRLFHARKAFQRAWAQHAVEPAAAPQHGEHCYG
jgi:RNA polymerase sigma-70 factor (ECF subfamily)